MYRKIFVNSGTLLLGDLLTKQKVVHYLNFYKESQWWSYDRLKKYQNEKIQSLIRVSYKEVPFYKEYYNSQGINLDQINTVDDLRYLPTVSKKQLKLAYPALCTRKTGYPEKEYFTSGSSGNPFAMLVDNLSMSEARALMILRANFAGWEMGVPVLQTGMSLNRGFVKKVKDLLFGVSYVSAFDLSNENLDCYLEMLERKKIKFMMGYPGSIYALACRAQQVEFKYHMSGIVTWGDNLYDHFRSKIEGQFGCHITDTYGCGEGLQVAAQCPSGNGKYHVFMPHVHVEIVDENFQPVKRGEIGSILLTKLEPGSMPLIRYQIGDVGRFDPENNCSCGRGLETLLSIDGRDSDFVYTPNGNRLIVHFFTGIFEYFTQIENFRVLQKKINEITILIVPGPDFIGTEVDLIRDEIWAKGDPNLVINFNIVDEIPIPSTGKRKFVISEIENV